ncbi:MAG: hypothetical protein ACKER6_00595 [Candidatus Hodgkinia cicadicola]
MLTEGFECLEMVCVLPCNLLLGKTKQEALTSAEVKRTTNLRSGNINLLIAHWSGAVTNVKVPKLISPNQQRSSECNRFVDTSAVTKMAVSQLEICQINGVPSYCRLANIKVDIVDASSVEGPSPLSCKTLLMGVRRHVISLVSANIRTIA